MSANTLKISIQSGGQTFNFDIQNINVGESSHVIQIVLPNPAVDDDDDDTEADDDTETDTDGDGTNNAGNNATFDESLERFLVRQIRDSITRTERSINEPDPSYQSSADRELSWSFTINQSEPTNNANVTIVENQADINRTVSISDNQHMQTAEQAATEHINETYPDARPVDDENIIEALRRVILRTMSNTSDAGQNAHTWNIITGDPTVPAPVVINAGDPRRPPIAFDRLISGHPMIETIRNTHSDSIAFYKEILTNFDTWIRNTMQSTNVTKSQFAIALDRLFTLHLLKFPRAVNDNVFTTLLQCMEEDIPNETQLMRENRGKLKAVIVAIKEGLLNDIVEVFDTPNCSCARCAL